MAQIFMPTSGPGFGKRWELEFYLRGHSSGGPHNYMITSSSSSGSTITTRGTSHFIILAMMKKISPNHSLPCRKILTNHQTKSPPPPQPWLPPPFFISKPQIYETKYFCFHYRHLHIKRFSFWKLSKRKACFLSSNGDGSDRHFDFPAFENTSCFEPIQQLQ